MYGKGFLGNMTENLQADCVQSRQAGFIQCFLYFHLLKNNLCTSDIKQTLTFPMADAFSVCQFIPFEKSRRFFLRLRLFHDFEIVFTEVFRGTLANFLNVWYNIQQSIERREIP